MSSNIYSITITTSSYTNPRVNSASVSATSQYIYLEVSATDGTNPIDEYCYSLHGGSYSCRSYDFFEFSGLSENVTYNIRIYAVDTEGYKSDVYTTSATTRYIAPVITSLYVSTYTNLAYASIYVDSGEASIEKVTCEITMSYDDSVRTYTEHEEETDGYYHMYIPRNSFYKAECWATDVNGVESNRVIDDDINWN